MALRALHLGKYYPPARGGMETYLQDLCEALERRGTACLALVHQEGIGKPAERSEGSPAVWRVPTWRKLLYTPISPGLPVALHQALRRFRPHILHLHWPNPWALAALFVPAARRIPWVLHWHSDIVAAPDASRAFRLAYSLLAPMERRLLRHSDCIVATSEAYLASSIALQDFRAKARVVPLGRTEVRMPASRATPQAKGSIRLLAAGRLAHYKGFDILIRAIGRCEGVHLTLAGDGEQRAILESLIEEHRLSHRVTMLGAVSELQLTEALAECDCLVLPSTERTEAFGIVLLEAMSAGKATIGSAIPGSGINMVVEHGKTGLMVKPGDVANLSEAIITLRDAPSLTSAMGIAGRARFEQCFHIDHSADQILTLYQTLAA